ncbi:MAG: GIY-YIG nuclease family protein [Anaerolineae bacterium]
MTILNEESAHEPPTRGTYALLLYLEHESEIAIGRLGVFLFPDGYYIYIGSALGKGGLRARLVRHLRREKKRHWHIDYFLEFASCLGWWIRPHGERDEPPGRAECLWAQEVASLPGAHVPAPGFGSSDCLCRTHLFHLQQREDSSEETLGTRASLQ